MPLESRLEQYYRVQVDSASEIADLTPISDGWETEVYAFTAKHGDHAERLILRMYPAMDAVEKSTREFAGMAALKASGYPVPQVYHHETNRAWLGKPFVIMQYVDGQPLGKAIWQAPERGAERFTRLTQLLVDLHRLPIEPFGMLDEGDPADIHPMDFLRRKLAFARTFIIDQSRQTWAIPAIDWLDARLSDVLPSPLAVLHNDFHPYNVLLTPAEDAYVIDWGNIEVGDSRYDLAWTLLLMGTMGAPQQRDQFLREYERLASKPVAFIEYFEVIAALRRLFGFVVTLTAGGEAAGMRREAADLMRGQKAHFEQVYAIFQRHTGLTLPEIEALLATL